MPNANNDFLFVLYSKTQSYACKWYSNETQVK